MHILREGISHYLTSDVIKKLRIRGIKTAVQFISEDLEDLAKRSSIPYKTLTKIRKSLVTKNLPVVKNGAIMYEETISMSAMYSTGCEELDSFLGGGIFSSEVTEFVGSAASGKTQLCFSIMARVLSESERTVLYIDTGGCFSASRISEMLLHAGCEVSNVEMMKKIHHCNVHDVFEFIQVISDHKTLAKTCGKKLGMIIVDSITPILAPLLGQRQLEGMGLMVQASQMLTSLAKEKMIAIIVCNKVVQPENGEIKPGLGKYWWSVPSVSLLFKTNPETQRSGVDNGCLFLGDSRNVSVLKSGRMSSGKSINFEIKDSGIVIYK